MRCRIRELCCYFLLILCTLSLAVYAEESCCWWLPANLCWGKILLPFGSCDKQECSGKVSHIAGTWFPAGHYGWKWDVAAWRPSCYCGRMFFCRKETHTPQEGEMLWKTRCPIIAFLHCFVLDVSMLEQKYNTVAW